MAASTTDIARLRKRIAQAKSVCALTGAGVSADSGVPTFRGAGGLWLRPDAEAAPGAAALWEGYRIEDVATPEAFACDPAFVWRFYDERRQQLLTIRPNAAHLALADLERRGVNVCIATQNIDDLHNVAGSRRVLELHGNIWKARCVRCRIVAEYRDVPAKFPPVCRHCSGMLRPHVVWFGEMLDESVVEAAIAALTTCDVLLVIGTSGTVYPVAGFPARAKERGVFLVEVNAEPTPITPLADVSLLGRASDILSQLIADA
jgi:NAD-dependent deacetylase